MISTVFRFLKRNWKEVLIVVCLLMVMGKMRADYNRLEEVHETMRTSLQDQITGLQEIHDEELRQRDAALRTYKEELEKLQRSYEVNLETIRSERDRKYQEYLHDFIKDPEQLAKDIEELFGFEYVE